ncbi:glycosyltransferase family 87 protein [uncultured Corynebacterium sp.]|uniref:glycosyltransferase family 87 protein n=1 Tax=uncultured Corynebacterium sp. TaxID=159447 RepID=UPI0025957749|nr:glycosyltransferase family 87 protein [uncultured Corynebacterium sp.]
MSTLCTSLFDAPATDSPETPVGRRLASQALWFAAVVGVIRAVLVAPGENRGTDFEPIWFAVQRYVHGVPVYNEDYSTLDPHYLYAPGANVVLAPLAMFGSFSTARWAMIAATALSVVLAMWITARLLTRRWAALLTLLAVAVFFNAPEPVVSTIQYTNINGFLLLVMVLFVWASVALDGPALRQFARGETYVAGVLMAYAVTVKPQFVVLAAVPVLLWQWPVLFVAAAVYAGLFGLGWATTSEPQWWRERLVPYLAQPRSYDNGSLRAVLEQLGFGPAAQTAAVVLVLAVVAVAVAALFRLRHRDRAAWAFCTLGALFAGVFLGGGLLQGYYAMWLIPMAMTVVRPHGPMRRVSMWVALLLALGGMSGLFVNGVLGAWPDSFGPTVGWVLVSVVLAVWGLRQGRSLPVNTAAEQG